MNLLPATITEILSQKPLHIVKFDFGGHALSMMSLDLSNQIKVNTQVHLTVNPSYIALAKSCSGAMSYSNQIPATILSINQGVLLSAIKLQIGACTLESIITTESSQRMQLKEGDSVTMLIKASELSIVEVLG